MAELTEEEKKKAADDAAKEAEKTQKPKKVKYEDLAASDTIAFETTIQTTEVVDGEIKVGSGKKTSTMTKAGWEALPKHPKGHTKEGQPKDISEGAKSPKLIGYVVKNEVVKF